MQSNNFQAEGEIVAPKAESGSLSEQFNAPAPLQSSEQPELATEQTPGAASQEANVIEKTLTGNNEQIDTKREVLEQFDKEKAKTSAATQSAQDDDAKPDVKKHAHEVYQIQDPAQQIERIVQIAITHDPVHAIKVAQHLDDNYVLNEVHDRLVEDQVREELIKRGLLKEI